MIMMVLGNTFYDRKAEVPRAFHTIVGGDFSLYLLRIYEMLKNFLEERMLKRIEESLLKDMGR
jgi:hypothetical protein